MNLQIRAQKGIRRSELVSPCHCVRIWPNMKVPEDLDNEVSWFERLHNLHVRKGVPIS